MKIKPLHQKLLCFILIIMQLIVLFPVSVNAAETSDEKLDFVILLDCTGSMKRSDEYEICNAAAKMFVDLMPSNNARVAVIAFGQRWFSSSEAKSKKMKYTSYQFVSPELREYTSAMNSVQCSFVSLAKPLSEVNKNTIRDELKTVIEDCLVYKKDTHVSVNPTRTQNNSYIGGALMAAADVLYKNKSENAAMILISDGRISGFGFDGKERGEIKHSNYDLIEATVAKSAKNQWPIYTIELNADGKNATTYLQTKNASTSMTAKKIMEMISDNTKGSNHEITKIELDQLVDAFMGIFSKFMEAKPELKQATIKNGFCEFNFNVPEVTSETNIVITGGNIDAITINGKRYASNTSDATTYFTKNENNGKYTLLKLITPPKGPLNVKVEGSDGASIRIQCVNTQDLPIGFSASNANKTIDRNTSIEFHTYLADATTGAIASADSFYKNNAKATITIKNNSTNSVVLSDQSMTQSAQGYKYTYEFQNAGKYTVTTNIISDNFRKGVKTYSYDLTVADYQLKAETTLPASGTVLTKESTIAVKAYFTGVNDKVISGDNIYKENETELQIFLDGTQIASVPMTADNNGYYGEYRIEKIGVYSYKVVSKAACLHNNPPSLTTESVNYTVDDFSFIVTPAVTTPHGNPMEFSDNMTCGKNSVIHFNAQLFDNVNTVISGSNLFHDSAVSVKILKGSEMISEFCLGVNEAKNAFNGDWRISHSGELTVQITLNDPNGEPKECLYHLNVTNENPTVKKEYDGVNEVTVGTSMTLNVNDYFSDNDLDILVPSVTFNANTNPEADLSWSYDESSNTVTIQAGTRANDCSVVFSVYDNDSTSQIEFPLTVINTPPQQIREFEIPTLSLYNLLGLIPIFDVQTEYAVNMFDYFSDPDGLPLNYSLFCESEFCHYDETTGELQFIPEKAGDIKFEITVSDSNGDTHIVKESVPVEHWVIKNIIQLIIAFVILMIIIFLIHKETKIGKVKIAYSVNGGYPSVYANSDPRRSRKLDFFCKTNAHDPHQMPDPVLLNYITQLVTDYRADIIGSLSGKITLKNVTNATQITKNGTPVKGKKIVLKKQQSVDLTYTKGMDNITITITNNK